MINKSKRNRHRKRESKKAAETALEYKVKDKHLHKTMEAGQREIGKDLGKATRAAEGAWIGVDTEPIKSQPKTLEEYKEKGFKVLEWDGM